MIPFNQPTITELEERYLVDALHHSRLAGDGAYTMRVYRQMEELFGIRNVLLTTSGTTALEMAALLIDLAPGDEVIVPSFTFSSTVNAFLLRGAKPVFCDIRPDTLNMDESLIEGLISPRTRAIYCVDYAGVPCEMDEIGRIARDHGLFVIEDAAQAMGSTYKGRYAGTLSEFGCFSFHETKNYVMGEGGAIVLDQEKYMERAEIIREKGTNRRQMLDGLTDKYTWHDIGSSFLPSDLLAALLCAQLERYDEIMAKRRAVWDAYHQRLRGREAAAGHGAGACGPQRPYVQHRAPLGGGPQPPGGGAEGPGHPGFHLLCAPALRSYGPAAGLAGGGLPYHRGLRRQGPAPAPLRGHDSGTGGTGGGPADGDPVRAGTTSLGGDRA